MSGEKASIVSPEAGQSKQKGKASASVLTPFRDAAGVEYVLLAMGCLFSGAAGALFPYLFDSMGDTINNVHTSLDVSRPVTRMAVAGALSFILQAIACFSMEVVADRLTARMRCKYVANVLCQSMEWYDTHDSAALSSRLDVCLADVRDGIGMKFVAIPTNIVVTIGALTIAFTRCWSIALCSIPGFIPCIFFGGLLGWAMQTTSVKVNTAVEEAGAVATETFNSIRTVAAFGGEKAANERYKTHIAHAEKAGIWGGLVSGVGIGGLVSSVFAMFTLVFYLSGRKAADSMEDLLARLPPGGEAVFLKPPSEWPTPEFQGGSALVISICLLLAAFNIGNISENLANFSKAVAGAGTIYEVIREPSKIDPTCEEGVKDVPIDGDLVFDSVTFSYPSRPDAVVFKNFSLRIPAGKSVAFVGPSGCGKSTLLQLTQRIYDPVEGKVSIAGKDLKTLNTRWYRSRLGVVMQEPRLFSTTIEENIRLGSAAPKAFAEVEQVAKQAHVAAFVEQLPLKYNTMCGSGGAQLSGGQKQRVALARALLRKPAVLILDEATSALDAKSEKSVQEALDEVIQTSKSTTLIVAHRLTTIQNVDEIIVLDNRGEGAEVVQRGTHEELLQNTQGLYYTLFQSQAGNKGKDDGSVKHPSSAVSADAATTAGALAPDAAETGATADDDNIVLPDPSEGNASAVELVESASGMKAHMLLARFAGKTLPPTTKSTARLSRAVKMLAPEWFIFSLMVVFSGLSGAGFPLIGWLLGSFLSVLFKPDAQEIRDESNFWSLMLMLFFVTKMPIELVKQYTKEYLASRLSRRLRAQAFNNLVYQDMAFFDLPANNTGILGSILAADVALVTTAATGNFVSLFHGGFSVIVGLSIGFCHSWRLSLVLLATLLLSATAVGLDHILSKPKFNAAGGSSKKKDGDSASGIFAEAVQGIRVVMSFGLEEHFSQRYEKAATSELGKKAWSAIVFGLSWGLSQSVQFFVFSLALWYGTKLVIRGEIPASAVMNTVFPTVFAASGLGIAAIYSADAKKAKRALAEVFRVIDRKSRIDVRNADAGEGAMLPDFTGAVDYEHVSFRYPTRPEQRVYKDLSFSILPGESVALVGASGCGKSTAVQLLLRFYDLENSTEVSTDGKAKPEKNRGRIRTDFVEVQDVNLIRLRSLIGLVSQEPILFNLTIGENIRYSKPDATQLEVEEAARMANAHGFISALPNGYDTPAGTAGAQLSGGQRQRIAIARALLRDPKILILDEATSALDAESEKQVQATLDRVVGGGTKRSTIIIAHRLSTVRAADKIVVLQNEDGEGSRVVEVGNHEQLMDIPNGVYRSLVLSSTERE